MKLRACEDQAWREGERLDRKGQLECYSVRLGRDRNVVSIRNGRRITSKDALRQSYEDLQAFISEIVKDGNGILEVVNPYRQTTAIAVDEFDVLCVRAHVGGVEKYQAFCSETANL